MGYSRQVYEQAQQVLSQRRQRAEQQAQALHARTLQKYPQLADMERDMAALSLELSRVFLDGKDVQARIGQLRQRSLQIQEQIAELLRAAGESQRNFDPQYTCPLCRDTGRTPKGVCTCLTELLREIACRQVGFQSQTALHDFDEVRLDYYPEEFDARLGASPRQRMQTVVDYCRTYADEFGEGAPNLLLRGSTGTGKTFLSLAIAGRVIRRGFSVIYAPVQQLLHKLEQEHFGRSDDDSLPALLECDLLVIDDLGTEFTTPFYISCLHQVINTRALDGKATIVSTNLTQPDMLERYGEQLTSRLTGLFVPLLFVGKDIRQILLQNQW